MKDSQSQQKKTKTTLRKKVNKNTPSKLQKPQRPRKTEKVIFEKKAIKNEPEIKKNELVVKRKELWKKAKKKLSQIPHQVSSIRKSHRPKVIKKQIQPQNTTKNLFKQYETDLQLVLIPLILLAILAVLMLLNNYYLDVIAKNKMHNVESVASLQPFPLAENVIPPDISAKAAVVIDADSQVILLNKNAELRFSMASTTKIMTALTGMDYFKDSDVLTVKSTGIEGSSLGLQRGEQLLFKDLMFAMMLPSANDAAVAIADNYKDGREAFVEKMNEKAMLLHLPNTHFADPSGLNDDENYTTALELARLASIAMKNPTFEEIVRTKQKTIFNTSYSKQYLLTNLNKLLWKEGVNGIKTGTTEGAGEVLVTSTVAQGHTFIIVVLSSTDRFSDTEILLDFVNEKVKYVLPPFPTIR